MQNTYLCHHGTPKMRWYHRRYQNYDGTYTEEGKARRRKGDGNSIYISKKVRATDVSSDDSDEVPARRRKYDDPNSLDDKELQRRVNRAQNVQQYNRLYKENDDGVDLNEFSNSLNTFGKATSNLSKIEKSRQNTKQKSNPRLDLSDMDDKELQRRIQRELNERQYNNLFNPPEPVKVSKGRETLSNILEVVGPLAATTASVISIYNMIKK